MAKRSLKILMLCDLQGQIPKDHDYSEHLKQPDWETEADIYKTLKKLGHEVKIFCIYDDIDPLLDEIRQNRPDLVFNLCEAFEGKRELESQVVALLELYGLSYTGAGSLSLQLCKDKGLSKKILSFHRIRIPKFLISSRKWPLRVLHGMKYPAFIKPLGLEASEGIAQMSFVENEEDALERIKFIHTSLEQDAIIEEYIEGREIYIGVMGNGGRPQVLPPRELFFEEVPEGEPKFATFKAKWDEEYRKRWGIKNKNAAALDPVVLKRANEMCKKIYRIFEMKGYARIDLRIKPDGEVVFIEANPNPSIERDGDFARSAEKLGLSYDRLMEKVIALADQ